MNKAEKRKALGPVVALAQQYRPIWDSRALYPRFEELLDMGWTVAEIASATVEAAQDPKQTPAGIGIAVQPRHHRPAQPLLTEPTCYACGRSRSACQQQQDWEIEHRIPDPHVFETEEDATANARPLTAERKAEIVGKIGTLFKRVNDVPGMAHAVESAQAAEELAAAKLTRDGLL